ncbi:MAG: S41 family peptidase [Gammaproteobacteria bacterium]|nr:S41 family peptidase [Gammaproteobacteria bacterium]
MRKIKILIGITLFLFAFNHPIVNGASSGSASEEGVLSTKALQKLTTVIDDVKQYYYKKIGDDSLLDRAISGMLSSLDPHSAYLGPEDLKDLRMETTGKFGGIGVEVVPDRGAIKVVTPLDDTPAYKAGIKAGDYIIQINSKLVRDMTLKDAIGLMRGKRGSKLNLTIIRKDQSKPLVFNLRRNIINIQTIKDRMLEPGYGYIRLALFQEPTARDLTRTVHKMQKANKDGLKGLVLDVRNNPGGLLESAVQIADDFLDSRLLKKNDLIVYTKGQIDEAQITAKATPGDLLPNIPIVVLINEGSASASEIVAGALQDHKRAIVVGTRSFGKGSVQTLIPLNQDSAIKLTTALYYTPLGRSIQAKGIEPDINVEDIKLAVNAREDKDIPRIDEASLVDHIQNGDEDAKSKSSQGLDKWGKQSKAELDLAYKDYQLYEALHILKSQNVIR